MWAWKGEENFLINETFQRKGIWSFWEFIKLTWKHIAEFYWNHTDPEIFHFFMVILSNLELCEEIFHRIFIPRPCFRVDKMSRAMEVFTGAWKIFNFLHLNTQNCHSKYRNRVGPTLGPKTLSISAFNTSLIHEL